MEVDGAIDERAQSPEYNDERKKKEILPPREQWPPVRRPPIRGKVAILEDRILKGHKVQLIKPDSERKSEKTNKSHPTIRNVQQEDAQTIMSQLVPLLEGWLRTTLKTLGIQPTGANKTTPDPAGKTKDKGVNKTKGNPNPLLRPKAPNTSNAERGIRGATTTPNMKLWSEVAKEKGADPPPPRKEEWVKVGRGGKA